MLKGKYQYYIHHGFKKGYTPWNKGKKSGIFKKCFICNKSFYITISQNKYNKGKFCSKRCKDVSQIEKKRPEISRQNHYFWKGGRHKHSQGYIIILKPEHPFCTKDGHIYEHRLIMEEHLGRYLKPEERMHHISGIKDDNRIENLKLFPNERKHAKHHFPKGSHFGINL